MSPPDTPKVSPSGMAKVIAMIEDLTRGHFYGSLKVKFRDGRPTIANEKRTIKLDGENPRKGQENGKAMD